VVGRKGGTDMGRNDREGGVKRMEAVVGGEGSKTNEK